MQKFYIVFEKIGKNWNFSDLIFSNYNNFAWEILIRPPCQWRMMWKFERNHNSQCKEKLKFTFSRMEHGHRPGIYLDPLKWSGWYRLLYMWRSAYNKQFVQAGWPSRCQHCRWNLLTDSSNQCVNLVKPVCQYGQTSVPVLSNHGVSVWSNQCASLVKPVCQSGQTSVPV